MTTIMPFPMSPVVAVAPSDSIIRANGVSKTFVGRTTTKALNDVSIDIRSGSFVSLVGPSGCGKTTLLNMVAGLVVPDHGEIVYDGEQVRGPNSRIGYMTQLDALLPWRTVLANVALPLEVKHVNKGEREHAAREVIRRVGLGGFEQHTPGQLSGGMRKRVSLARTLIYKPKTLLLDEPLSALDAQTRALLQMQLRQLVEELGLTVVLVTHDINEAIALSDTIVVFSRRPARILETIDVDAAASRNHHRSAKGGADADLYDRIWAVLANEIDIAVA